MSVEQIKALAELVKEIGVAGAAILAAFYGWRNARRTQRIEKKVDAHEENAQARNNLLVQATSERPSG